MQTSFIEPEEEAHRTVECGGYYAIGPMLPELQRTNAKHPVGKELSSADNVMSKAELEELLRKHGLLVPEIHNHAMILEG